MLDSVTQMLVDLLGPLGPLIVIGLAGVVLILVTLVMVMPKGRRDPMDRLREETRRKSAPGANATGQSMRRATGGSRHSKKLEKYAAFLEPTNEQEMSDARLKMIQAGYYSKTAVRDLAAIQFILSVLFLLGGLALALLVVDPDGESPVMMAVTVLGPTLLGYYGPRMWVDNRRSLRQEEIIQGFPDALDMLLICIEAGQSLDQAIQRVGKEIGRGYPALGEELQTVSHEIRAGKDRADVLKDMGKRCGVRDIDSFVTVMVQSATFGTSIGDALRVFAEEMRDKRVMTAEEKANVLPTKLTLGTMMFTVPPLLIILIGPSVLGISEVLGGGVVGG